MKAAIHVQSRHSKKWGFKKKVCYSAKVTEELTILQCVLHHPLGTLLLVTPSGKAGMLQLRLQTLTECPHCDPELFLSLTCSMALFFIHNNAWNQKEIKKKKIKSS